MSDTPTPELASTPAPKLTKAAKVLKLLSRRNGATAAEIMEATGWQPHSTRSHLTRLRQSGRVLERVTRKSGPAAYKLASDKPPEPIVIGRAEEPQP